MGQVIVRYRVKTGSAEKNTALVKAVYGELHRERPEGLRYATFLAGDGVTFYHVASVETRDGSNPLNGIGAFAEFQKGIVDRCDEPPAPVNVRMIDSYNFFAGKGET